VKEDEMDKAWGNAKCMLFWLENLNGRGNLGNVNISRRTLLKCMFIGGAWVWIGFFFIDNVLSLNQSRYFIAAVCMYIVEGRS
jgi:hypothetical protein